MSLQRYSCALAHPFYLTLPLLFSALLFFIARSTSYNLLLPLYDDE